MSDNYINFLKEEDLFKKQCKRKKTGKTAITFLTVFAIIAIVCSLNAIHNKSFAANQSFSSEGKSIFLKFNFFKFNILNQLSGLIEHSKDILEGGEDDRINVLALGIGGGNHEGGQLTDTIILISIKPSTEQVALISIPRDLLVPIKGYGWQRINNANALGEYRGEGDGVKEIKEVIENITAQSIDYYVKVDFAGFEKIINHLGGVCFHVDNDLIDYKYPVLDKEYAYPIENRFEYLKIESGEQCFDGSLALKYARSRHAIGIEGSDFARAKRQQKLLTAIKEKATSLRIILNPKKVVQLLNDLNKHVNTDLKVTEIIKLAKIAEKIEMNKIVARVLDNSPEGVLKDSVIETANGQKAFVLETKSGDFEEIKLLASNIFELAKNEIAKNELVDKLQDESAKIELQNGTKLNGWAYEISLELKKDDLNVAKIGNSLKQNYPKTIIYSLEPEKFKNTIAFLQEKLNADVSYNFPVWIETASTTADILVILGKES